MEVEVARVLEAMVHMELRLTAALAGSGGEQDPESFSYATASSAIAPRYDDSVFGSSAVPAYDDVPVDDELYRDEIAKVFALLEYNGMTSSATILADYTTATTSAVLVGCDGEQAARGCTTFFDDDYIDELDVWDKDAMCTDADGSSEQPAPQCARKEIRLPQEVCFAPDNSFSGTGSCLCWVDLVQGIIVCINPWGADDPMLCSIPLPVGCPVVSVSDYRHRPRAWEISSAACVRVAMASLRTDKPSWQLPSTKYDFSTMLTDVARIGVMVTVASKPASTSLDAHVVFDEKEQSWNFIFAEYAAAAGHHHLSIVWQIAEDYSHCEFLLQLPIYCPMPAFRAVTQVQQDAVGQGQSVPGDKVLNTLSIRCLTNCFSIIQCRFLHSCNCRTDAVQHRQSWPPPVQYGILGDGVQVWLPPWPPPVWEFWLSLKITGPQMMHSVGYFGLPVMPATCITISEIVSGSSEQIFPEIFLQSLHECRVCLSENTGRSLLQLPCHHLFCLMCMKSNCRIHVIEGNLTQVWLREDAVAYFKNMFDGGLRPTSNAFNKVIDGWVKVDMLNEAHGFFDMMPQKDIDDVTVVIFYFGGQHVGWEMKTEWLSNGWLCLVCGASDTQELPLHFIKLAKDTYTSDCMFEKNRIWHCE
jgi:pentatricopeptide repeat protein